MQQIYKDRKKKQEKKERRKKAEREEEKKDVQTITVSIRASPTHVHYLQELKPDPNDKVDEGAIPEARSSKGDSSLNKGRALFDKNRSIAEALAVGVEKDEAEPREQIKLSHHPYARMLGPSSTCPDIKFNVEIEPPPRSVPSDQISLDDVQLEIDSKLPAKKTEKEPLFPKKYTSILDRQPPSST